jgi:pantothenate kinase
MPHISLRVTEQEKIWMDNYARVQGISLSDAIKNAFFEKLEDEFDLKCIQEYEAEKAEKGMEYYAHDEVMREFGLR